MYQSVGSEILDMYAQAMALPLYRANILGTVLNTNLEYEPSEEKDEVEDLYRILKHAKEDLELKHGYKIEGVSSGAILSTCKTVFYCYSHFSTPSPRFNTMLIYNFTICGKQHLFSKKNKTNKTDQIIVLGKYIF